MIIENIPSGALGVNTYLLVDETEKIGAIIDPGGYNSAMTRKIQENGYQIQYILLTHGHGDHIGGVKDYLEDFKTAKLVAAAAEQELLANAKFNMSRETCGREISLAADISVNDGDTLNLGQLVLKFIMTPGHTPGGMCILAGDTLFSGDTLFNQSIGRTDLPGGSFKDIISSVKEKLFLLQDDTKVFPGHMSATTIGFEKRNNPFV